MQITNTVLMIRPVRFRMNEQTAVNNYFQEKIDTENQQINHQAQQEFDTFVQKLRLVGVKVIVVDDFFPSKRKRCLIPYVCRKSPPRAPRRYT